MILLIAKIASVQMYFIQNLYSQLILIEIAHPEMTIVVNL
jgi:hypothetical protein